MTALLLLIRMRRKGKERQERAMKEVERTRADKGKTRMNDGASAPQHSHVVHRWHSTSVAQTWHL